MWLKESDRNSKFFHASVKASRKNKRLEKLLDVNGNYHKAEASKGEVATSYFSELFKSTNPSSFQDIFNGFAPRVTYKMNENLTKDVTAEEVKKVVLAIKSQVHLDLMECQVCFSKNIGVLLAYKSQKKCMNFSGLEYFL